jgi:serine/threonine-protein kinase RsbW
MLKRQRRRFPKRGTLAVSRIRLVIKSELPNVSLMAMAVHKFCVFYGMDEVQAFQIELCVSEAATNSILHAYRGNPECEVSLMVSLENHTMTFECVDKGRPMNPEQMNRVNSGRVAAEVESVSLSEGGRGLQIIRSFMDEVLYSTDNQSNCLRMTKRVRPCESSPV